MKYVNAKPMTCMIHPSSSSHKDAPFLRHKLPLSTTSAPYLKFNNEVLIVLPNDTQNCSANVTKCSLMYQPAN